MKTVIILISIQLCYFTFRIMSDNQDHLLDFEYDGSTLGEVHLLDHLNPEEEPMEQNDVVFLEKGSLRTQVLCWLAGRGTSSLKRTPLTPN